MITRPVVWRSIICHLANLSAQRMAQLRCLIRLALSSMVHWRCELHRNLVLSAAAFVSVRRFLDSRDLAAKKYVHNVGR